MAMAIIAPDLFKLVSLQTLQLVQIFLGTLLIPVFVVAYARLANDYYRSDKTLTATCLLIAGAQMLIYCSSTLLVLFRPLPFGIGAISLIALTVVILGITENWKQRSRAINE